MKKFCFCIPLVESGIVVGVYGTIVWILYFIHASFGRSLRCEKLLKEIIKSDFLQSNCNNEINILIPADAALLVTYAILTVCGIGFELLLIYAFMQVKLIKFSLL